MISQTILILASRIPYISKRIYRDIENSLLNEEAEPGTFHLKHKRITLIAARVTQQSEHRYLVTFGEGHGILDGGHTYELILKNLDNDLLPEDQYVKFET